MIRICGSESPRRALSNGIEPLPVRGREEGWLRPMGVKEGGCQVFQVRNGNREISLCHTGG